MNYNTERILKDFIKDKLIKFIYPYLLSDPNNFEKLLGSGVGVYLGKTNIIELNRSLNTFYEELDIESLKSKINFQKEVKNLTLTNSKINILTFNNLSNKPFLNIFNIWRRRLSLLRFCRISTDLLLLNEGQQIPPHAHRGVLSGFILLEGKVSIKHFHAKEYKDNGIVCKKTIDKTLEVGGYTTNTDNQDNIHWLKGEAEKSILFRFNMTGLKSEIPELNDLEGRIYIDPTSINEVNKLAPFINSKEVKLLKF